MNIGGSARLSHGVQRTTDVAAVLEIQEEAEMMARLDHPNVLGVHGVVVTDAPAGPDSPPVIGIMTQFMPGGCLSAHLWHLAQ